MAVADVYKALEQFLSDVHWGELDTLVVDMPPGTGDVSISLGQLLPRAEVVVVTTPQPAAQQVAVRAAQMAEKTNMRLVGAVENMSYLVGSREELRRRRRGAGSRDRRAVAGRFQLTRPFAKRRPGAEPCGNSPTPRRAASLVKLAERIMESAGRRGSASRSPCRSPVQPLSRWSVCAPSGSASATPGSSPRSLDASSGRRRAMGSHGSTGSPSSSNPRPARSGLAEPGFERWDGNGALGYLALAEICDAQIASPPEHARLVVVELLSHGRARVLDAEAGRRGPRRLADRDVAGQARTP